MHQPSVLTSGPADGHATEDATAGAVRDYRGTRDSVEASTREAGGSALVRSRFSSWATFRPPPAFATNATPPSLPSALRSADRRPRPPPSPIPAVVRQSYAAP